MDPRKAFVEVEYQGVNITADAKKDLVSFSYTDHAAGQSDSVYLILKDIQKKWRDNWLPQKGDVVKPVIRTKNWLYEGDRQSLTCGQFFADEPELSGWPSQLTLNAVSAPLNAKFNDVDITATWENITLTGIAGDIAGRAGLRLETHIQTDPLYEFKEQTEIADAAFLEELCNDEGLQMKATDQKLIVFDEQLFEQRPPVDTILESDYGRQGKTLSYDLMTRLSKTAYAGVKAVYWDAELNQEIEFLYAPGGVGEEDKIYTLNERVKSGDEARRRAVKKLRDLNKPENIGTLSLVGNVKMVGGACVTLQGFGAFDGKYYIESATHEIGSGYTTDIEIRQVLEGY